MSARKLLVKRRVDLYVRCYLEFNTFIKPFSSRPKLHTLFNVIFMFYFSPKNFFPVLRNVLDVCKVCVKLFYTALSRHGSGAIRKILHKKIIHKM